MFLNTKKGKKARKQLSSLLIKELGERNESSKQSNAKVTFEEDDNHLYQLIRGVPTVLIVGEESAQRDEYVPVRNDRSQLKMVDNKQKCATPSTVEYIPISQKDRVIDRPGEHPFIPWNEYDGCCREGEYDLELDAFVKHHFRSEKYEPIVRKRKVETKFTVTLMIVDSDQESTSGTDDYSPKRNLDLIDPPSEQTQKVVKRMSNLIDSIERPLVERAELNLGNGGNDNNPEPKDSDLIDRNLNLIDRNLKKPKIRKLKRKDHKPKPELDVFFDNFEREHYERELELSSANLKLFSDSKNYAPEKEMLEWRYRADVATERVSYLQDLKTERERKAQSTIVQLENKIKSLSRMEKPLSTSKELEGEAKGSRSIQRNLEGSSSVGDQNAPDELESSDDE